MILETTFLVDLLRGRSDAAEKLSALVRANTPISVTAPSLFELFSGLSQSSKPAAETERIHSVMHQQVIWTLDDGAAERGGRIHGSLNKQGATIQAIDAMIAGIALQHQEPVLTRNVAHFSRVPGLKVESY
ncbi:PIN domain-containing protein [Candidatus Woesearchaeota archaeon]|nr:PIN domain-containing protein [Candidatus Woesearchaeota archaeon]